MTYIKYTAIAAALGLATAVAMPVNAAPNKDQCKAEFSEINSSRDVRLDSDKGKQFSEVASQVDVNKDGMISSDEYIVACTKDILKETRNKG